MAIVTKTRTYNTGDSLPANYYNEDRDEIIAGVNSIDNAQISAGASINEGKIAFNAGGHGHSGGSDGKPILAVTNRAFIWHLNDLLLVGVDAGPNPCVPQNMNAIKLYGYIKTPATGADLKIEVRTTLGALVGSLTVPALSQVANATFTTAIPAGTYLRLDVTQIGSSYAGLGLTATLECQQT